MQPREIQRQQVLVHLQRQNRPATRTQAAKDRIILPRVPSRRLIRVGWRTSHNSCLASGLESYSSNRASTRHVFCPPSRGVGR